MSLLIIDNRIETYLQTKATLEAAGYEEIRLAFSARHAFQLLGMSHAESPPAGNVDAILLSIDVPDLGAAAVCRQIKGREIYRDTPIVVLSPRGRKAALEAAFANGAFDCLLEPVEDVELVARVRSAVARGRESQGRKARLSRLLEVNRRVTAEVESLRQLAYHDELTGLASRRQFNQALAREWARSSREGTELAILMADVDYFKGYNDRYGHLFGDLCLREVATVFGDALRRPADLAARYGGEEFAAVLPRTDIAGALSVAESVRNGIAALHLPHAGSPEIGHVTVSVGVAAVVPVAADPETLVRAADQALYAAKRAGRNRVVAEIPSQSAVSPDVVVPTERERSPSAAGPDRSGLFLGAWEDVLSNLRDTTHRIEERVHSVLHPKM
jgi:diguanylate cyclase (GGDEF)-like protein